MKLFQPVWMTDNEKRTSAAIKSIDKIVDQTSLKKVALTAPLDEVKIAAIKRITDSANLKQLAQILDANKKISLAIIEKVSDQSALFEITISGSIHCSFYARQKLDNTNRKKLIEITESPFLAANTIMDGLNDDDFLRDLVIIGYKQLPCLREAFAHPSNAGDTAITSIMIAALANIHDQEFLYDVVMGNINGPFIDSVYNSDKDMGSGVYKGWSSNLRETAVWNIHDDNMLFTIVTEGPPQAGIWEAAISRMKNSEDLHTLIRQYNTYYDKTQGKGGCAKKQLEGGWNFYRPLHGCPTIGWDSNTHSKIEKKSRSNSI